MFTLSAFADEISPDPQEQIDVLKSCGVRHIEFRSILKTNVLALTDLQIQRVQGAARQARLQAQRHRLAHRQDPDRRAVRAAPGEVQAGHRAVQGLRHAEHPHLQLLPARRLDWDDCGDYRREVLDRMWEKCELAEKAGVRLLARERAPHLRRFARPRRRPDEHRARPVRAAALRAVYDPANYVFCGYDPWEGWEQTKQWTVHFHIKDWKKGEAARLASPAKARGRFPSVIADAVERGYDGFATMEPHLLGGGPTGGQTGPELFPKAVAAFKKIVEAAGGEYQ